MRRYYVITDQATSGHIQKSEKQPSDWSIIQDGHWMAVIGQKFKMATGNGLHTDQATSGHIKKKIGKAAI